MNPQEQQLRLLIREGIRIVQEKRKDIYLEEQRLRDAIRHLIPEVAKKTAVADKVIQKYKQKFLLEQIFYRKELEGRLQRHERLLWSYVGHFLDCEGRLEKLCSC